MLDGILSLALYDAHVCLEFSGAFNRGEYLLRHSLEGHGRYPA